MTHGEQRLLEEGWDVLVERLGLAEATRFVMLLDRRTGGALQHLRIIWSSAPHQARQSTAPSSTLQQFDR
ncbi:hypothetical protein [Candidatus Chloroploca asiatica]|uniref:Uncharacterized protein n=1 Tax=Candidatus Chloroploca asiatica TaxID=1506545 RepID=A0A2H3L3W1_9CHLR|nr:hypothetical protein [Candidatus Chloroploca asiatica]PDV97829.1 hypothetical protein A9Q02_17425 [Candidatus Chloroploca asiatica]